MLRFLEYTCPLAVCTKPIVNLESSDQDFRNLNLKIGRLGLRRAQRTEVRSVSYFTDCRNLRFAQMRAKWYARIVLCNAMHACMHAYQRPIGQGYAFVFQPR